MSYKPWQMIFSITIALCLCRTYAYLDVYTEDRNLVECGGAYSSTGNCPSDDEEIDYEKVMKKVISAQVAIMFRNNYQCSGFLVTRRHVLTAAHCIRDSKNNTLYEARIGHTNVNQGQKHSILAIKVHERYETGKFYNDIALLTLNKAVEDTNIDVVCLPDDKVAKKDLTKMGLSLAGWGTEQIGNSNLVFYLSTVRVVSNQECSQTYKQKMSGSFKRTFPEGITPDLLCAYYYQSEKETCGGDSGVPLMLLQEDRWYAVGIVTFGGNCLTKDLPIGAVRVSSYANWIRNNIHTCV